METGNKLTGVYCAHNEDEIWGGFLDPLKYIFASLIPWKIELVDYKLYAATKEPFFIVLPLFENKKWRVLPTGLSRIRKIREDHNWWSAPAIFLVNRKEDIPDLFLNQTRMTSKALEIIRHPGFGDKRKAVLCAEAIYNEDKEGDNKIKTLINVIYVQDLKLKCKFEELLNYIHPIYKESDNNELYKKMRKDYYNSFIDYYNRVMGKDVGLEEPPSSTDSDIITLEKASKIHDQMSGGEESGTSGHIRSMEIFRAPIPFLLQEVYDARIEIEGWVGSPKKISCLLIDNKIDKFDIKGDDGPLNNIISHYKLNFLNLRMLGNKDKKFNCNKEETFDWNRYKKAYNDKYGIKYKEYIYKQIIRSDVILLDFFLNKEDTYLAFDFINDIMMYSREYHRNERRVNWYFITSAVMNAVANYSQSGILSEFYESAVVCSGDDPVNKKRRIIFVYKLLTFIRSRINAFEQVRGFIEERMLKSCDCKKHINSYTKYKCLRNILVSLQKLRGEVQSVQSIVFEENEAEEIKRVFLNIENLINQFLWLPDPDCATVQTQIDYLNTRLKRLTSYSQCEFGCKFIKDEIEARMNRF